MQKAILDKTNDTVSTSDAVISGLFAGILGGLLMAAYVIIVGWANGTGIGLSLSYFSLSQPATPFLGLLTHLAVSGIYGLIFGLLARLFTRVIKPHSHPRLYLILGGLIFSLLLWLVARGVILPSTGAALQSIPALHFLLAHLVFGLGLGIFGRRDW